MEQLLELQKQLVANKQLGPKKWGAPVFALVYWKKELLSSKSNANVRLSKRQGKKTSTHAEYLAIKEANSVNNYKKTLWISYDPCDDCTKYIKKNNIKEIIVLKRNETIKDRSYLSGLNLHYFEPSNKTETDLYNVIVSELEEHNKRWAKRRQQIKERRKKHAKNKEKSLPN